MEWASKRRGVNGGLCKGGTEGQKAGTLTIRGWSLRPPSQKGSGPCHSPASRSCGKSWGQKGYPDRKQILATALCLPEPSTA